MAHRCTAVDDDHLPNLHDEVEIALMHQYLDVPMSEAAWETLCNEAIADRRRQGLLRSKRGRGRGKDG